MVEEGVNTGDDPTIDGLGRAARELDSLVNVAGTGLSHGTLQHGC